MVVTGPNSGGQSAQRHPAFNTKRMPLITRRSSTRCAPGRFLGRCGSIADHASSLNHSVSVMTASNHGSPQRRAELRSWHDLAGAFPPQRIERAVGLLPLSQFLAEAPREVLHELPG